MKGEASILVHLALRAFVEVFLQGVCQFRLVLQDEFGVVGHIAQRVVIMKRPVGARESNAVGALVVGKGRGAIAAGVVCGFFFGTVFQRVVVARGERSEAGKGQQERQNSLFHGLK